MHKLKRGSRILFAIVVLLVVWQLTAQRLDNDILIPYPQAVLQIMLRQFTDPQFYEVSGFTLMRAVNGFLIALIVALVCAYMAYVSHIFADLFYPILLLTRSVPNISYIIIVLFWFRSETSVMVISFLILFPTMYANLINGLQAMDTTLLAVLQVYPATLKDRLLRIYLPHLRPYLFSAMSSGISLAFKVGIMAEILGQVATGIGRQLNIARMNLDMASIFAWTIWIIIILFFLEHVLTYVQKRIMK